MAVEKVNVVLRVKTSTEVTTATVCHALPRRPGAAVSNGRRLQIDIIFT
eukprot:SAG31_NODE_2717_length_5194_cov_2.227085_4_plen_49_part_00